MDDERDWTDRPLGPDAALDLGGATLRREAPAGLSLVSGDLTAAQAALCPQAPMLGLAEPAPQDAAHGIRIGPDRALLVLPAPASLGDGWHAAGFAHSRADGLYVVLALTGPEAPARLSAGLASPLPAASPSAAIRFAGTTALLTGLPDNAGLRLWVEAAHLTYITGFFQAAAAAEARQAP